MYLKGKFPVIDFKWIIFAVVIYIGYLAYCKWLQEQKQPSFKKMIAISKEYALGRGKFLDDSLENVWCEPLGEDYFAIRFVEERFTFIIYKNILIGKSTKEIHELQDDNDKSSLKKILAQKGVTEVIEI